MLFFPLCFYGVMVQAIVSNHIIQYDKRRGKIVSGKLGYGNRSMNKISVTTRGGHGHGHGHGHVRVVGRINGRRVDHHSTFGGGIKPHNVAHGILLREMINNADGDPGKISHNDKDLANMAAHGNINALKTLHERGLISDKAVSRVAEGGGLSPHAAENRFGEGFGGHGHPGINGHERILGLGNLTAEECAALLAPAGGLSPRERTALLIGAERLSVEERRALISRGVTLKDCMMLVEAGLGIGRNGSVPFTTSEEVVTGVTGGSSGFPLVQHPPHGSDPDKNFVSEDGIVTGRTNGEQLAINALLRNEHPIDEASAGSTYTDMVGFGHSSIVAKGAADEVRDANARRDLRLRKAYDLSQPAISPLYISQVDLAHMTNSKDTIPDEIKLTFMKSIFDQYHAATGFSERAEFEAGQAGLLIDEYNSGLANGLSPGVAYGKAMDAVQLNYKSAARSAAITSGGQRVAQDAADKALLERETMDEMVNTPIELRTELLRRKMEAANSRAMDRAKELNNDLTDTHIREPIIRAHQKLQQAAALKDAATLEGVMNPVVEEKILTDVAIASSQDSVKARGNLEHAKEKMGLNSRKISALNLLSKVNTQKAISEINHANEERQKTAVMLQTQNMEKNRVKAAEEELARGKESEIIKTRGERAFVRTYERTGDPNQAEMARANAEEIAKGKLARAREMRKAQVMRMLGPGVANSAALQEVAEHIALAHAGLNPVGPTLEDIKEKYEAEMKNQMNTQELLKETAASNLQVKEVIPPTASKVGIIDGKIKLPLKGFSGEEAKTEEEALVQGRQNSRRNQVRNKVVGVPLESGLNVIETSNGFTHISEAAKFMDIHKGTVFYPENAKAIMDKQNIDTSALEHRFNTGERSDLEMGMGYYKADASGFRLSLPSPSDPVPPSSMTNRKKVLNIEHASGINIEVGDLVETPWAEFVKNVRPTINGIQLQEDEVEAASELKARDEEKKRLKNLEGITTEVYTNPDGSKFVEVTPPYGVPEFMSMGDAVESLNSIGASSVSAVSEEVKKQSPDIPLDMATTTSEKGSEEGFISAVLDEVGGTERGASVDKNSGFNGEVNGDKAAAAKQAHEELIKSYLSPEKTVEAEVKNALVNKADAYVAGTGIQLESFLKMVSQIPDGMIKEMVAYNQAPSSGRKDITTMQFFNHVSSILPKADKGGKSITTNAVLEIVFNNIANVTHQPNTVGGEIVERVAVPKLKELQKIEVKKTPNGVTETSVTVPNQPKRDQVLEEFKTKPATPKISSPPQPVGEPSVPTSPNNPSETGTETKAREPLKMEAGVTPSGMRIPGYTSSRTYSYRIGPTNQVTGVPTVQTSMTRVQTTGTHVPVVRVPMALVPVRMRTTG